MPKEFDINEFSRVVREHARAFERLAAALEGGHRLECVECGDTSLREAFGWRTYLTIDNETATYCPDCAREEFGGA